MMPKSANSWKSTSPEPKIPNPSALTGKRKSKRSRAKRIALWVAGSLLLLYILPCCIACHIAESMMFPRYDREQSLYIEPYVTNCPREKFTCQSSMGTLACYLYETENPKAETILIVPGKGAGADDYLGETQYFLKEGYRVIAYDGSGCYGSEGKDSGDFSQGETDLTAVLSEIHRQGLADHLILFGHSMGAFASVRVLDRISDTESFEIALPQIESAVLVSGCNSIPQLMLETAGNTVGNWIAVGYPVVYGFEILKNGYDCVTTSASETVERLEIPVLILQGSYDDVFSPEGCSLYAHKDTINSPLVQAVLIETEGENGHTSLIHTEEGATASTMKTVIQFLSEISSATENT